MFLTTTRRLGMATAAVAALATPLLTAPAATAGVTTVTVAQSTGAITIKAGINMPCTAVTLDGPGVVGPPTLPFSFTSSTWTGCTGPLSIAMNLTQIGTWTVSTTAVMSLHVHAQDAATGGGVCSFDVSGNLTGTYNSTTQVLSFPGSASSLSVTNVVGCFALIGSTASLTGAFHVTTM